MRFRTSCERTLRTDNSVFRISDGRVGIRLPVFNDRGVRRQRRQDRRWRRHGLLHGGRRVLDRHVRVVANALNRRRRQGSVDQTSSIWNSYFGLNLLTGVFILLWLTPTIDPNPLNKSEKCAKVEVKFTLFNLNINRHVVDHSRNNLPRRNTLNESYHGTSNERH